MWMVWMRMVLVCVDGVDEDGVDVMLLMWIVLKHVVLMWLVFVSMV